MEDRSRSIRNVAFVAHGGSGKTSLAEAFLFNGKATTKLGKVDEESSNLDFEPEEMKRRITISTSFHHCDWKKRTINVIDTPGDDNFLSDTKLCLQAADGAVVVIDATSGVKVGTEKVWGFCEDLKLPRMIFINKLDRERASFDKTLQEFAKTFDVKVTPLFLPIGEEDKFEGVVDIIGEKAFVFKKDGSGSFKSQEIPANLKDKVAEWREKILENIVEVNDALMEKYLEGESITPEEIKNTLFEGIKKGLVYPVLCGSALLNIGVTQLMDLIVDGFPDPLEIGKIEAVNLRDNSPLELVPDPKGPFYALVVKTLADPFAGKLSIMRVFSGSIGPDGQLYNVNKDSKEKYGQILTVEGKRQQPLELAVAGDIIAIAKLKDTATGDTLSSEDKGIAIKNVKPIPPSLYYAVQPKVKGTEDKVFSSLTKLAEEDPGLLLTRDQSSSEILLSGAGQVHLDVIREKLLRKYGVEVELKAPKIPYRETIKKAVKGVIYRHKKQTGGRGQFAEVHFDVFPLDRGAGFEFEEALVGMNVPRNFVPAVEKGVTEALQSGILAGYPVVDLKVRFYDGKSHEVDSSDMAFKIAASMCLKKALQDSNPVLLEPIMKVEVMVPDEMMGDVMGDLNSRRGRVLGMESKGKMQVIKANVPMAEILQYALDLNSITGGRGSFTAEFSHYEEVPAFLAEKVISAAKQQQEEQS